MNRCIDCMMHIPSTMVRCPACVADRYTIYTLKLQIQNLRQDIKARRRENYEKRFIC